MSWHIISGEYPPQPGGVSDYTRFVACGLAEAGDCVHVWAPACAGSNPADRGVEVRRMPGHFGPRALLQLSREFPESARILVQYVPHAFGWKAMNVPFCLWLWSRRRNPIWMMFHEVAVPVRRGQPLLHTVLGVVNRGMAWIAIRAADRIWVTIPAWETLLRKLSASLPPIEWLPVPSNIPVVQDPAGVAQIRSRYSGPGGILIGHFGTYAPAFSQLLTAGVPAILERLPDAAVLLLGRGSREFAGKLTARHPEIAARIHATGGQRAEDLSRSIGACDLLVQLYPNGVSSRNASMLAALAHGRPVVATSGSLTEPFWRTSPGMLLADDLASIVAAVEELAQDREKRERTGAEAAALYRARFDLRHTISVLRSTALRSEASGTAA